jgi:hypothetical protein
MSFTLTPMFLRDLSVSVSPRYSGEQQERTPNASLPHINLQVGAAETAVASLAIRAVSLFSRDLNKSARVLVGAVSVAGGIATHVLLREEKRVKRVK